MTDNELRAWRDPVYPEVECQHCRMMYVPTLLEQKYCTKLCKRAAYFTRRSGTWTAPVERASRWIDPGYCEQCNDWH